MKLTATDGGSELFAMDGDSGFVAMDRSLEAVRHAPNPGVHFNATQEQRSGVAASKVYAAPVLLPIAEARRVERIALGCRAFAWRISRQGGRRRIGVVFLFRIAGRLLGHGCHPSFDANAAYCRTHVRRVPVPR